MARLSKSLLLGCVVVALVQHTHATSMTGSTTVVKAYVKTRSQVATVGGAPSTNANVGPLPVLAAASVPATVPAALPVSMPITAPALVPVAGLPPAYPVMQVPAGTSTTTTSPTSVVPAPAYDPVPGVTTLSVGASVPPAPAMGKQSTVAPTLDIAEPTASGESPISLPEIGAPTPVSAVVPATNPSSAPLAVTPMAASNTGVVPTVQPIEAVANIDPTKRGVAKTVVKTTIGDAKIKAKAYVRNTPHGTVTKTKVKVRGELPPGVTVNAIANVGNTTAAKASSTDKNQ